ncbi:MAG TPA: nitroreductase [Sphingomicrobium sp.]|nr:nitroreductase [Sphingomicrobium sp.]
MLNDVSTPLSLLETRRSGKPRELVGPGPDKAQLERILSIAARVPDHGKLQPWRFVTVAGDQRDALAKILLDALDKDTPEAGAAHREKEVNFAHLPGQLIVLLSAPTPEHKIPVFEQQLSAGAAGMNLLLAAHAMGFVAGWVTGWRAYSDHVRAAFCQPGERIAGFIFIGEAARPLEERPRPSLAEVVRAWVPPST